MRLCLVSLDFAPARSSGLTVYAERLAHRLVSAGHIVTVIAAHRPGTFRRTVSDNLCIERIPIGYSDWIAYSWWAARYVEKLQCEKTFNIVHFLDVHFAWLTVVHLSPVYYNLFDSALLLIMVNHMLLLDIIDCSERCIILLRGSGWNKQHYVVQMGL